MVEETPAINKSNYLKHQASS